MLCQPVVVSPAAYRFGETREEWQRRVEGLVRAAEERVRERAYACYWRLTETEEITHLEALQRGLTAEALRAEGWWRCAEKDAWRRQRRA